MENIKDYTIRKKAEFRAEIKNATVLPKLVIIQVNEDPASCAYIKGKIKDLEEIGAAYEHIKLPIEVSEEELIAKVNEFNDDPSVTGIIVQMPLPKQINEEHIKRAVIPAKDVDGFNPLSTFRAATPNGIITYLKDNNFDFVGKNAVVIGRSNIVGRPAAQYLLDESANVTVLHSKTKREDMERYLANADLIIVAVGKLGFLDNSFKFKDTAIVVDVGINRNEEGKLKGDAVEDLKVAFKTPVPGGVGLLTRLSLLSNLMKAYKENK